MAEAQDDRNQLRVLHNNHPSACNRLRAPRSAEARKDLQADCGRTVMMDSSSNWGSQHDNHDPAHTVMWTGESNDPITLSDSAVLSRPGDSLLAHVARFAALEDEQSLAMTLVLRPADDQPISLSDSALICISSRSSEEIASMRAEQPKSFNPAACLYFQPVGSSTVELEVDEPFAEVNHEETLGS